VIGKEEAMRTVKGNALLSGLGVLAAVLGVLASSARADVTIEKGSSILVFPKVLADGTYDTTIQITNTGNSMVQVKCYYVNATLFSTLTYTPCTVPSATCVPQWQETDFSIWLTKQQPTHWLASAGRQVDPFDGFGNDGSGFDPGHVPPVADFQGELKCVEVDLTGEPVIGNHLKGEATIKTVRESFPSPFGDVSSFGDVSKYNAIGIPGNPSAIPSNPLLLDGNVYNACPSKLILNHFGTLAADPVAEAAGVETSAMFTLLTLVPCSEDFENQQPTSVTVQFLVYNEFEERFSASTTVTCYLNTELTYIDSPSTFNRSVFSSAVLGSDVAQTEITPVVNTDGTQHAVIGIAERVVGVTQNGTTTAARAAYNLHTEGSLVPDSGPDQIRLTEPTE
jgi:hypothetical protein